MKAKQHFPSLLLLVAKAYFYQALRGILHKQVTEAFKTPGGCRLIEGSEL